LCCSGGEHGLSEVTSVTFFNDALTLAAGTSTGRVMLFDIRAGTPTLTKSHNYDLPIKRILQHSTGHVLSADDRVVKLWDGRSGANFTTIENPSTINDVAVCPNSGLLFVANEAEKMGVYFIPVQMRVVEKKLLGLAHSHPSPCAGPVPGP
jgi:ribosome biogenesis protein ENP2